MNTNINEKRKIHLICNAHIDPVWLWNWEEGAAAAISTFKSAVRFCKEYDEYVFNHNEAVLYKWIEEYDPDLFSEIKELIKAGKWHVIGGWYLQPDCNMPSGESFVRQIEEGRRYFMEKFGVDGGKTAINFDPFGHTIGLVQILKDAGYDNYIICRPAKLIYDDTNMNDKQILWKGYNNKSIHVFKATSYGSRLGEFKNKYPILVGNQEGKKDIGVLWGVGNHGGGPSKKDLDDIRVIIAESDDEVVHTYPDKFFEEYFQRNKSDREINRSLHSFSVGCYTSMTRVKQKHRELENKLLLCEKMMSHAIANGLLEEYEHEMMHDAWQDLLFCEFHDSLPGSSIQIVENDILKRLDHGLDITDKLIFRSYFRLVKGQKPAKENEYPVLVYNPHPYRIKTNVECEYVLAEQNRIPNTFSKGDVYDENGNIVICQNEKESSNVPMDWAKKVVFQADLAPMSVNRFNIVNRIVEKKPVDLPIIDENFIYFDNGKMNAKINRLTGHIDSYIVNGNEYIKPGMCQLLVIQDNCDSWGMTVSSYQKIKGRFKLANPIQSARICGVDKNELEPVRIIESSELRTVVEASFVYSQSSCNIRYTFNKNDNIISVNVRVFSQDKNVMYKLSLPTVLTKAKCVGKTSYGRDILMTNGNENVSHQWLMLKQDSSAFAVINTSTYGSSFKRGEIRMSVLRTPGYSAHPYENRQILPLDRFSPRIDIGERVFDYYLWAGEYEQINEQVDKIAVVEHQKPIVLNFNPSEQGQKAKPFCLLNNESIELITIRKCEDSEGYQIRLFNNLDRKTECIVNLPIFEYEKKLTFKPFEIMTFICSSKGMKKTKLV